MTASGRTRLYAREDHGTVLHLPARLVKDSKFPFQATDELEVRIVGRRLVVRKLDKRKTSKVASKKSASKKRATKKRATKKAA